MDAKHSLFAMTFAAILSMTIPVFARDEAAAQQQTPQPRKCHWWQFGRCNTDVPEIEGLPDGAPRTGTVITVDVSTNKAYLFEDGQLLARSQAAIGSNRSLGGKDVFVFESQEPQETALR